MNAYFSKLILFPLWAAALLCLPNIGSAAIMRDDVPSSAYEAFFKDPIFQSVGWLVGTNANGTAVAGSGVLIAPDWVLTAAHVIDSPFFGTYESMKFSLSDSIYTEPPNYTFADKLFMYPGWKNDQFVGNDVDLGLIHLSTPITSVTPATRYYGTDERGTLMMMAGFGTPGTGTGGLGTFHGIGRAGNAIANAFANDPPLSFGESQYWTAEFNPPNFPDVQPLAWLSSPGDSGGGWFADIFGDGSYELVGIHSFGKGTSYFSLSGSVRISMYNDWGADQHQLRIGIVKKIAGSFECRSDQGIGIRTEAQRWRVILRLRSVRSYRNC